MTNFENYEDLINKLKEAFYDGRPNNAEKAIESLLVIISNLEDRIKVLETKSVNKYVDF